MAITDKTRKLLWGRSGGFCAICKQPLTEGPAGDDPAVVLGEECHIVSHRVDGPRYRPMPPEQVHGDGNLILLCPTDHTRIDKQLGEFTEEKLLSIKLEHEAWVARLPGLPEIRVRVRNLDKPVVLHVMETGQQVMGYVAGAHGLEHSYPEPADRGEAELLAGFLSVIDDWATVWGEFGPGQQVEPAFEITEEIRNLLGAGFVVYCGRREGVIEGGLGGPSAWEVCVLSIFRVDDSQIRKPTEPAAAAGSAAVKRPQLAPLGGDTWRIGDVEERGASVMHLPVMPIFCDVANIGEVAAVLAGVSATASVGYPDVSAPPTIPSGEKGTLRVDFQFLYEVRNGDSIELTVPYRGPDGTAFEPLRFRGHYLPPGRWEITPLSGL